ncbi:hypothetical protein KKG37_01875, partial [Patescibacteria group bacterium]|nr:hypothetical protein [Patescibacteria group bacterium]
TNNNSYILHRLNEKCYPFTQNILQTPDKDYLLTVSKVLSLATRVKTIFESSEIHEKRALLNYLIQNPSVNGKKLYFSIASPYNLVLDLASNPTWLRILKIVRTFFAACGGESKPL